MKTERKVVFLAVFSSLSLLAYLPRFAAPVVRQEIQNPDHMIVASVFDMQPFSLDPVDVLYRCEVQLIINLYETLVFFDVESSDAFVPRLATKWTISPDCKTYTFKIRGTDGTEPPVQFHNGEILTTEDVEYSFERALVRDNRYMGYILYEPLLGVPHANLSDPTFSQKIDDAIERNATHVWFNLAAPYSSALKGVFLQILSQCWSSILSKDWCIMHGAWSGTWENWQDYHDLESSPISDLACGTGPYTLDYKTEVEWSILKFDDYWGGWPAMGSRGFVTRVTTKHIDEWTARRDGFLVGEYDIIYLGTNDLQYIPEVWKQPGTRCVYPLPRFEFRGIFYTFNISTTSPYMGVPGGLPRGTLAENGIPPDFFTDVDVRKGFAYAFNYTQYIEDVWFGEAVQPATVVLAGLPFRNPAQEKYVFDLAKAKECFQRAWGGELWQTGFTFTFACDQIWGSPLKAIFETLKASVETLNPKFHINEAYIEGSYNAYAIQHELPLWYGGWNADYADPHNLVFPFMHSQSHWHSEWQQYCDPHVDQLIEQGVKTANSTTRQEIYYELQSIYHNECISVPIAQPAGRHWERDWVQGWYYTQLYWFAVYHYPLWKESLPIEDINMNGEVDIFDVVTVVSAFGSYYAVGDVHPYWNSRADFNLDQVVDIFDVVTIAKKFGFSAPPWTPPV